MVGPVAPHCDSHLTPQPDGRLGLGESGPQDQPLADWRLGDLVRVLEDKYEGIADDLGREGLLAIPAPDLHDAVRDMVREVYIAREHVRVDLEIEKATRHFGSIAEPTDADVLQLLEYLDYYLHDLVSRMAVDALQQADDPAALATRQTLLVTNLMIERQERDKKNKDAAPMPLLEEEQVRQVVSELAATHLQTRPADPIGFLQELSKVYGTAPMALAHGRMNDLIRQQDAGAPTTDLARQLRDLVREEPDEGESPIGLKDFRRMERYWLLTSVDKAWMAHLLNMDELREGIHLRGHAQRDPLIEYQREASELFDHLMAIIAQRTTQKAFSGTEAAEMDGFMLRGLQTQTAELPDAGPVRTVTRGEQKIPRNAPCPCGSGKKYKVCCMKD